MAQVPPGVGFDATPQITQLPLGNPSVKPEAFVGNVVGQGMEGLGQATEQAAQVQHEAAMRLQDMQNKQDSDNALTQYYDKTTTILRGDPNNPGSGFFNLKGQNAMAGVKDATAAILQARTDLQGQLKSPMARMMFEQESRRTEGIYINQVKEHASQQYDIYMTDRHNATIQEALKLDADNIHDPAMGDAARQKILAETADWAKYKGLDAGTAKAMYDETVSKLAANHALQLKVDDPIAAQTYIDQHRAELGAHAVGVIDSVHQAAQVEGAHRAVDALFTGGYHIGTGPQTTNMDDLLDAVGWKESGNNPNIQDSAKGAGGQFQLMPGTRAMLIRQMTPQLGREPTDKEMAKEYLSEQVSRFGVVGGLAAYNAGPGVVADWINGTNNTGKNPHQIALGQPPVGGAADWIAKIPFGETKDYVTKVLGHLQSKSDGGLPQSGPLIDETKDIQGQIPAAYKAIQSAAENLYPTNHALQHQFIADAKSRIGMMLQEQRDQVQHVGNNLNQILFSDPTNPPKTLEDVKAAYSAKFGSDLNTDLQAVAGFEHGSQLQAGLLKQIDRNLHPTVATPEMYDKYQRYLYMSYTNPEMFKGQVFSNENLPRSMITSLINKQAAIAKQGQNFNENVDHFMKVAAPTLAPLRIKPGSSLHQALISGFIDYADTMHALDPTHKFSDKDYISIAKRLIVQQNGTYEFQDPHVIPGVPNAEAQRIGKRLMQMGRQPDAGAIAGIYRQQLSQQQTQDQVGA